MDMHNLQQQKKGYSQNIFVFREEYIFLCLFETKELNGPILLGRKPPTENFTHPFAFYHHKIIPEIFSIRYRNFFFCFRQRHCREKFSFWCPPTQLFIMFLQFHQKKKKSLHNLFSPLFAVLILAFCEKQFFFFCSIGKNLFCVAEFLQL